MIDFGGRVALVTGAGWGLGFAYAQGLAERGATVVLHDVGTDRDGTNSDPAIAEAAAQSLASCRGKAVAAWDAIATRDQCRRLTGRICEQYGRLDILIHNAGWVGYQTITELEPDFLHRMTILGIDAPLWLAQAAWGAMKRRRHGRILLTTSDRAIYPEHARSGLVAYAAAKSAAIGIVNVLAAEGAPDGILCNAISPVAKTRVWQGGSEGNDLRPEMIVAGALYLVSDTCTASGWVLRAANGQFHATSAREAAGVDYPRDLRAVAAADPEEVARAWGRIAIPVPEARP
jgi:NAD(P)-dependent dehydrogenase (short-subunit alcohol dehydrogenase family)